MRQAGRINAEALAAARAAIRPGASTADLNAAVDEVLQKHGVYSPFKNYPGPYPYPASTTISINEELVHGIPNPRRKLREGDIVSVGCGTVFEELLADSAFSAGLGSIHEAWCSLLQNTVTSLYAGLATMGCAHHPGDC